MGTESDRWDLAMSGSACWQSHLHAHDAHVTSDPAGYIWASKRWASAELLQLRLFCGQASSQGWMSALAQAATSLSKLDGLLLDCFEEDFKAWESVLDMHLLNIILLHTQHLRVLQLGCYAPTFLMPLGAPGALDTVSGLQRGGRAAVLHSISAQPEDAAGGKPRGRQNKHVPRRG